MKAVIIYSGFGLELRPLSFTKPKPLVEFYNITILEHQLGFLKKDVIQEIYIIIGYLVNSVKVEIENLKIKYPWFDFHIIDPIETRKYDKNSNTNKNFDHLDIVLKLFPKENELLLINGDLLCDYSLEDLIYNHHQGNKESCDSKVMISTFGTQSETNLGLIFYDEKNGNVQSNNIISIAIENSKMLYNTVCIQFFIYKF